MNVPTYLGKADSPRIWRWVYFGSLEQRNCLLIVCFMLSLPCLRREENISLRQPEQILLIEAERSSEITIGCWQSVQVWLPE